MTLDKGGPSGNFSYSHPGMVAVPTTLI